MKRLTSLAIFFFSLLPISFSQQIIYSEALKEDNRNMNFEILGNFNGNYIIYKNTQRKHRLTIYDRNMAILNEIKLDFISEKTFNVDFITYPDYFLIVYQYQKGNRVYCNAAKIDGLGKLVGSEIALDTTKIAYLADNKIYYLTNSEDKKKILLYKMLRKNDSFILSTSLYNNSLQKLDSTQSTFDFNDRKESYGDLEVTNDGAFYYTKETTRNRSDYTNKLEIYYCMRGTTPTAIKEIPLDERFVQDTHLKIDNVNKAVFLNSLSYKKDGGVMEGIFTVKLDKRGDSIIEERRAYTLFDDSLRDRLSDRSDWHHAFDNFYLRNIVLKKDSGILISMEQYFTQSRGINNRYNRYGYYDPYSFTSPTYYSFQRSYSDPFYYRNDYPRSSDLVYNYSDILLFSLTKDLTLKAKNIINKKQNDVETDNFLSYSTLNMGSEIHYLFVDKTRQVISDFGLQPDGEIKRYATIKSGEVGYSFMPKLLKQVSSRQVIVPCILRSAVAFAKIDFSANP